MPQQVTRPTIGIPVRLSSPSEGPEHHASARSKLFEHLVGLIEAGGALAVRLEPNEVDDGALADCDGFLLPGGGDVDPSRYSSSSTDERLQAVNPEQDALDFAVARFASDSDRPLLAICRGMQVLNVSRGGSLHIDLPSSEVIHSIPFTDEIAWSEHEVDVEPETLCARSFGDASSLQVASSHHQGVDRVGTGLRVTASASDGGIEAIEDTDPNRWVLGVQWHPEADTAYSRAAQLPLFTALVTAADAKRNA